MGVLGHLSSFVNSTAWSTHKQCILIFWLIVFLIVLTYSNINVIYNVPAPHLKPKLHVAIARVVIPIDLAVNHSTSANRFVSVVTNNASTMVAASEACPAFGRRSLKDVFSAACGIPDWMLPSCEVPGAFSGVRGHVDLANSDVLIVTAEKHLGRLGNVLFSYASAWATARRYSELTGLPACALYANVNLVSRTGMRADELPLRSMHFSEAVNRTSIWVPLGMFPTAQIDMLEVVSKLKKSQGAPHILVLGGFLQSEALFAAYRDDVRRMFMPRAKKRAELLEKYPQLPNAICMHVRLGDKLSDEEFMTMLGPYYRGALAALNVVFPPLNSVPLHPIFIASENVTSLQGFGDPFFNDLFANYGAIAFSGHAKDDLWALSLCGRGIVAASSTFSWWAAYLRANLSTPVVLPRSFNRLEEPSFPGWVFPKDAIVLDFDGSKAIPGQAPKRPLRLST